MSLSSILDRLASRSAYARRKKLIRPARFFVEALEQLALLPDCGRLPANRVACVGDIDTLPASGESMKKSRKDRRCPRHKRAEQKFTRLRAEPLEERRLLTTFVVVTTSDSGTGSLRDAMLQANADP
ncbi:MAG: hypothetical protein ACREHD_20640, partial [Pirellulales bacterium]